MKLKVLYILIFLLLLPFTSEAQCSMCRAVLQSQGDPGAAEGINRGIMYLMAFPYLLMGGIGYFIWRSFRKKKEME